MSDKKYIITGAERVKLLDMKLGWMDKEYEELLQKARDYRTSIAKVRKHRQKVIEGLK